MWQLIKQVLKSFKSSILLIFGLIFISFTIIFSSFSFLYLSTNTSNSSNNLITEGNKSNAIIEKNYAKLNLQYDYLEKETINNQSLPKSIDKLGKENKKQVWQSKLNITTSMNSGDGTYDVVWPWMPSQFSSPVLNEKGKEFATRTPSQIALYGANSDGTTTKMELTNSNKWYSASYGFAKNGNRVTNLQNLVYDDNGKLIGYFQNDEFTESIPIVRGFFGAGKADFNGNEVISKPSIPSVDISNLIINVLLDNKPFETTINVSPHKNYAILDRMQEGELINFLERPQNKEQKEYPFYTIKLNDKIFTPLQKDIYENILTPEEKSKINNIQVVIKPEWLDYDKNSSDQELEKRKAVQKILDKKIESLKNEATKLFEEKYENAVLKKIDEFNKKNGTNIISNDQSQYVITDQLTSNKYIVSQKDGTEIDKIFYTKGTKLSKSSINLSADELFKEEILFDKKYMKNYIRFLNESVDLFGDSKSSYIKNALESLVDSFDKNTVADDNYYNYVMGFFYSPNLYVNPSKLLNLNRQGASIEYQLKGGFSRIFIRGTYGVPDKGAYSTVVTKKFIELNNKDVLPNSEWVKAQSLSSDKFIEWINKLDSKYYIDVNSRKYVIIGIGISPEMAFPSTSIESPIPSPKTESIMYVNKNGYESILLSNPLIYQNKYFSLSFGKKILSNGIFSALDSENRETKELISKLNAEFKEYINPSFNGNICYSLDDFKNNQNLLTMRSYFPNQIQLGVSLVSLVVIMILICLGLYLSYLLIKGYISKNQVQLAIIKANGFSSFSITMSISLFGLVCSIIAGSLGYILAYFMQGVFFSIINPYWYIPTIFLNFSPIGLIGGIVSLFVVFAIYTFIILKLIFKKPINQLISENVEIRASKLLNVMKIQSHKVNPLSKFTISLSLTNIWRSLFFISLCSIGIAITSIGFSIPKKFERSNHLTSLNKDYTYKFTLKEPTEQSGLYKKQKYSNLGFTDLSQGLVPLYKADQVDTEISPSNSNKGILYNGDWYTFDNWFGYPYDMKDLKVRNIDGSPKHDENGNILYYGNIMIPSYRANDFIDKYSNFYHNAVFVKWMLDFTVPGLNLNPWEIIKGLMPTEAVVKAEVQGQAFLKAIYNDPDLGKEAKTYLTYDTGKNIYGINTNAVIGSINLGKPDQIGFKTEFLHFIGKIYGKEELSNLDVKLSFGIIPYTDDTEFYSSALSKINKIGSSQYDNEAEIIGLKNNSKFITLKDNDEKSIGSLIDDSKIIKENNELIYPLIVNNGAAYKYNLKVGSIIEAQSIKGYFRYSWKMADKQLRKPITNHNKKIKLKVVGISSSSFNNEFYVSQKTANIINGSALSADPTDGGMFSVSKTKTGKNNETNVDTWNLKISYKNAPNDFVPFNGMFTKEEKPIFLEKNLSFLSDVGVWNLVSHDESNGDLSKAFRENYNLYGRQHNFENYFDTMVTRNKEILSYMKMKDHNAWDVELKKQLSWAPSQDSNVENGTLVKLAQYIYDIFGKKPTDTTINTSYFDNYGTITLLYSELIGTIGIVQNISISIAIPLIIVMILIISYVMMNEFRRMIIILKTLGYSDKENITCILLTFLPIILLSVLFSMLILFAMLSLMQYIIYSAATVFITSGLEFLPTLYGIVGVLTILIINFGFIVFMYKKQKLKTAIVD